jgi:nicotinamidase-related amidase
MLELRRDAAYEAGQIGLLYVDMQMIWVDPGLDASHPDWTADHDFYRQLREVVVPNQQRLLEAVRAHAVA